MCGVFGIYNFNNEDISERLVRHHLDTLEHRGPDASGIWAKNNVGIGHTRLSIIDLSNSANQPFMIPDKKYVLAYNGEVHNLKELRKKIKNYQRPKLLN